MLCKQVTSLSKSIRMMIILIVNFHQGQDHLKERWEHHPRVKSLNQKICMFKSEKVQLAESKRLRK